MLSFTAQAKVVGLPEGMRHAQELEPESCISELKRWSQILDFPQWRDHPRSLYVEAIRFPADDRGRV